MSNKEKRMLFSDEDQVREDYDEDFAEEDFDEEGFDEINYDEEYEEEYDSAESEDEEDYDEEEYDEEAEDDGSDGDQEYDDEDSFEEDSYVEEDDEDPYEQEDGFENKIDAAMSRIVADTDREVQENRNAKSPRPYSSGKSGKSARPKPVAYVPIDEDEFTMPDVPVKKKHKGIKVTGVAALMVIVAAGCAYGGVSYYYSDKFFDGTTINGIDCSRKTPYEVEQLIAENVENYSIQVSSRNLEPQEISGDQIDYKYVSDGEVLKLLKQQKPYEWIRGFFEEKSYSITENISYNKEMLQNQVLQLNCAQKENQVAPENAYVAFADTQFEIVPETEGSELNVKQAYQILDEAVAGRQETIDFAGNPDAYVAAAVTSEDPGLQATLNACNNFTKASITYTFGEETVTLDGSTIKDWLQFDDKGQYVQDDAAFQQHVAEYVSQLAAQYDTVGTGRNFNTTSGRTVYVYGVAYGWKIDQGAEVAQLIQDIQSGTQTTRDPVYEMTANSRGYNDIGNTYIEVDMSDQHMYYYQDGAIIFDSDIVSGNMSYSDRQTPEGIYTLYYKKSPDVLKGEIGPDGKPEYETPVQYWMPFNGGIGFHDADWQPYFGGDRYLTGGSHGCINMPPENAAILYSIIQYGVPIVCFY